MMFFVHFKIQICLVLSIPKPSQRSCEVPKKSVHPFRRYWTQTDRQTDRQIDRQIDNQAKYKQIDVVHVLYRRQVFDYIDDDKVLIQIEH